MTYVRLIAWYFVFVLRYFHYFVDAKVSKGLYYFLIILCFYYCTLSPFQYSCRKQTKFRRDLILIVTLNTLFCFLYIFGCWYLSNFNTHFCDRLQLWKKLKQLKLNTLNMKVTYMYILTDCIFPQHVNIACC